MAIKTYEINLEFVYNKDIGGYKQKITYVRDDQGNRAYLTEEQEKEFWRRKK